MMRTIRSRQKYCGAIRARSKGRTRDRAMFDRAIDSKVGIKLDEPRRKNELTWGARIKIVQRAPEPATR